MNTPAHVVASVVAFRAKHQPQSLWPAVLGGVLPDTPMYLFYAYEKLAGQPEHVIWSDLYFRPGWQTFFDSFNSIPIVVFGVNNDVYAFCTAMSEFLAEYSYDDVHGRVFTAPIADVRIRTCRPV